MSKCTVCFRNCEIPEGSLGFCKARICRNGQIMAANYGKVTSMFLDPIEKKPLSRFYPGSMILSVGSYGCNLRCPFCQNYRISWSEEAGSFAKDAAYVSPEKLAQTALRYRSDGNIGVAFTYNEPLIGYEYVLDAARLVKANGMKTVLVTNATASLPVLAELAPFIDAMNIDLKGFTDRYYKELLKGDRGMVMDFIRHAARICHVELTTLIIPGENDSEEEMNDLSSWVASLDVADRTLTGADIPLHISRFFPYFHMTDRAPTDVAQIYRLADTAKRHLKYVYTGNC